MCDSKKYLDYPRHEMVKMCITLYTVGEISKSLVNKCISFDKPIVVEQSKYMI